MPTTEKKCSARFARGLLRAALMLCLLAMIFPATLMAAGDWQVYWPGERLPIIDYMEEYPDADMSNGDDFGIKQGAWMYGHVEHGEHWELGTIALYPYGKKLREPTVTMLLKTVLDSPFDHIDEVGSAARSNRFYTQTKTMLTPIKLSDTDNSYDCESLEDIQRVYQGWDMTVSELINVAGKPALLTAHITDYSYVDGDGDTFFDYTYLSTFYIKMDEPTDRHMTLFVLRVEASYRGRASASEVAAGTATIAGIHQRALQKAEEYANHSFHYETLLLGGEGGEALNVGITTPAAKDPGEKNYFIPAAIVGAVIAGALATRGSKNKSKKERKDEDEEESASSYEMRIRKDFGDTLRVGHTVPIYARIVEITPEGAEVTRLDLTEKIIISSPQYLQISGQAVTEGYKGAYVEAPEATEIPAEAEVAFRFAGAGAGFTNHVIFQIADQKVIFGQDNLTLPSNYSEIEKLPFAVLGVSPNAAVSASISPAEGYSVEVEKGEEEGLYYALIKEKKKEEGRAGDYEPYTLTVAAEDKVGSISGELPVYRFHMGLRLDVGHINCFAEEYDQVNHSSKQFLFEAGGKEYVPAETKAAATIFTWDKEKHEIVEKAPAIFEYGIDTVRAEDRPLLDQIAVQCEILDARVGGGRALIFRPYKGALDAPSRIEVEITLKIDDEENPLAVTEETLLCSQPLRETKDVAGGYALIEADAHITDRLLAIRSDIYDQNFVSNLFPLLKLIDVMLEGYHEDYGYDARQVEIVRDTWGGFLQGNVAGANAEAETVTLADEVMLFVESFMDTAESVDKSLGFVGRMALGVATLGCYNIVTTPLQVARGMTEYVRSGGDSAFDAFVVGAKIVTVDYLTGKAMSAGFKAAGKIYVKSGANLAVAEMKAKTKDGIKRYATALTGRNTRTVITDSVEAGQRAVQRANSLLQSGQQGAGKTARQLELDRALQAGREVAQEQVQNLQAAAWMLQHNPTAANRQLMNELTIRVQSNKLSMYALQNYADESLDSTRRAFNETLAGFYTRADRIARDKLASITGIPASKIQVLNASSSSQALMRQGKKITIDRDWTGYHVNSKGEQIFYHQALTEQIYNDSIYEATFGVKSPDAAIANRFAQRLDQAVIEDVLGHRESYGVDLGKMLDRNLHKTALSNPEKVASTVSEKGREWFRQASDRLSRADAVTNFAERQLLQAEALSLDIEGCRQLVKQYDNCVNPRDIARRIGTNPSKIAPELRTSIECCRRLLANENPISVTDLERSLQSLGFTKESLADALGDAVRAVG